MTEFLALLAGLNVGLIVGLIVGIWGTEAKIRDKAKSGMRLAIGGKLYDVRASKGWEDQAGRDSAGR